MPAPEAIHPAPSRGHPVPRRYADVMEHSLRHPHDHLER
jgi:hypothetical protein